MTSQLTTRSNILIVDADAATRDAIGAAIATAIDMLAIPAGSGSMASAIALGRETRIDAMIVAADLDDETGEAFCARLRRLGLRLPILLMAADASEQTVVDALDAGANDVITQMHRPAELLARLRAHLRCHSWCDDVVLPIGPYQFRPGARLLQDQEINRRIRLTDKETAVLKFLYRAAGVPVGRRALLREVWGYAPGATTHTVETHIYRLRRKIEPDPNQIMLLLNDGGGYRLAPSWTRPAPRQRMPANALEMIAAAD
jgi:DNA-binding response OmpR family regulator